MSKQWVVVFAGVVAVATVIQVIIINKALNVVTVEVEELSSRVKKILD